MHNIILALACPHRISKAPLLGALLALLAMCALGAQEPATGSVAGRVYNPVGDAYVRNAEIQVEGTDLVTLSGEGGYYRIDNLPAGDVTLVLRYAGARTSTFTAHIVSGATARLELTLLDETASTRAASGEIVMLDAYVVSSEREGNAKAFMEQKNALNMKNVVASDAFGEVTQGNIAEFLQYLPGLTIDYRGDDARAISIRGLDPKYGGVTMDGARMATSSSSDPKRARQFEFEQVSINSVETIEVNKTLTAEHEADAPAGVINLRSKSPLDRKRMRVAWQANVSASSYEMAFGKSPGADDGYHYKVRPGGQVDFSNVYFDGKVGLSLTANLSNVFMHGDNYYSPYLYGPTAAQLPQYNPENLPSVILREVRFGTTEKINRRRGVSAGLDFQPTQALRIMLRAQWSDIATDSHGRTMRFYAATSALDPDSSLTLLKTKTATITQLYSSSYKTGETVTLSPSFTYKKRSFELDGRFGYSKSKNEYRDLAKGYFIDTTPRMGSEPLGMSRANTNSTAWNVVTNRDIFLLENYTNSSNGNVASRPRHGEQEQYSGALNLKWAAPWKLPTYFKTGLHYRDMTHMLQRYSQDYTFRGADNTLNTADDNFKNYISPYVFRPDLGGNLFTGDRTIQFVDRRKLAADFFAHAPGSAEPWFVITNAQAADAYTYQLENYTNYQEKVPAVYLMGTTKLGKLTVQAGLRYEHTTSRSEVLLDPIPPEKMASDYPGITPGTVDYVRTQYHDGRREWQEKKYGDLFMSASARWAFTPNLIARAGFSQSIHRPELDNLSRAPRINDETWLVTLPNPYLRPEYSNNFSIELEYYLTRVGRLSVSVFHNRIRDVQYQTADLTAEQAIAAGMRIPAGIDPSLYWFRTTLNGDLLDLSGVELEYRQSLTFLPGILKNLGVFATFSRTWFNDEVLAGGSTSPYAASGGVWFDYRRLKLSAKGTWTDEMFDASGAGGEIRRLEPILYINVEASYDLRFKKRSRFKQSLFISGRNIFNEYQRVYSNVPGRLYTQSTRGATWVAGFKGTF